MFKKLMYLFFGNKKDQPQANNKLVAYGLKIESFESKDTVEYYRLCAEVRNYLYYLTSGHQMRQGYSNHEEIIEDIDWYLSGNWNKKERIFNNPIIQSLDKKDIKKMNKYIGEKHEN